MFELEVLPVTDEGQDRHRLIVYRPRARLAFVGNQAMADLAVAASHGKRQPHSPADAFLERIGFLAPDPPLPPAPAEEFRPATAVLLMIPTPGLPMVMPGIPNCGWLKMLLNCAPISNRIRSVMFKRFSSCKSMLLMGCIGNVLRPALAKAPKPA